MPRSTANTYIFGYGSICDITTLRTSEHITRPLKRTVIPAILDNHKVVLNKRSYTGNNAYANIMPCKDKCVYGIIVPLCRQEVKRLDKREGTPIHYERVLVTVRTRRGEMDVYTYIARPDQIALDGRNISHAYYNNLSRGLQFMQSLDRHGTFYRDPGYFQQHEKYYYATKTALC